MGNLSLAYSVNVTSTQCCACGVIFGIPADMEAELRRSHKRFFCPNGHGLSFSGESEEERLRREIEAEKKRTRLALERENAERAEKDKLARKLKRVGRGTCPECNRSFQNLARHMNCKHGDKAIKFGKAKLP